MAGLVADSEVEEAFTGSFLARLPPEVARALRAEGERTEYPPGTTVYQPGAEPHAARWWSAGCSGCT